jgi:hypothetical protein
MERLVGPLASRIIVARQVRSQFHDATFLVPTTAATHPVVESLLRETDAGRSTTLSPTLGSVMEDLLTYGEGLEVAERDLLVPEVGKQPQSLPDQVIAVVRDGRVHRYFDPAVTQLVRGDRLIVVRPAQELPWAPRPGTHGEDTSSDEG